MKNLIIGLKAMDERYKEEIHNTFFKDFGIDLDSDEFTNDDFYRNWEALLKKCGSEHIETIRKSIAMFKNAFLNVVNPRDVIIRSTPTEEKLRKIRNEEFIKLLKGYSTLLDNFYIYEADVWINAWLAIQYEKRDERRAVSETKKIKPKPGYIDADGGIVEDRCRTKYMLPFEKYADDFFGDEYLKYTLGKNGTLFWTEEGGMGLDDDTDKEQVGFVRYVEGKNFIKCMQRGVINISAGKDYKRFSYQEIEKLERQKSFRIEDKILFHKTINGILVRNMINTMIDYQEVFAVEDYIGLIDTLCECKSLVWQNLISYIFIPVKRYQKELKRESIYDYIVTILFVWISNIDRINYRLSRLTEGFLYLYQKTRCPEEVFKEKCEYYLQQLELKCSKDAKEYWMNKSSYLRMPNKIEKFHDCPEWIYAIFQREVIHRTKYLYRNGKFLEKPFEIKELYTKIGGEDVILKNIPMKFEELQPTEANVKDNT